MNIKRIIREIPFYFNILGQVQTWRLASEVLKEIHSNAGISSYYKLIDDAGVKHRNPKVFKRKLELLLPIPDDISSGNSIDIYVNDQKLIIEAAIYESGVASVFNFSVENKFTEDEDEKLVVIVIWKMNPKHLLISIGLWLSILSILLSVGLVFLK